MHVVCVLASGQVVCATLLTCVPCSTGALLVWWLLCCSKVAAVFQLQQSSIVFSRAVVESVCSDPLDAVSVQRFGLRFVTGHGKEGLAWLSAALLC
jgi:hypothetical protein